MSTWLIGLDLEGECKLFARCSETGERVVVARTDGAELARRIRARDPSVVFELREELGPYGDPFHAV